MDKSVKFRIELETNGEKVFQTLNVNVEDFKSAVGEAVKEVRSLGDGIGKLTAKAVLMESMTSIVGQLSQSISGLADTFNRFDEGMRAVNTMAGLDESGLKELTAQVEELSKSVPLAREELANGLYQVISNGVPEGNWLEFLGQSSKAAVGGIADLGQTVTVTSTIIKNYGLEWSAAGEIQDKIQATAKNGVTSFEQLAQALPRVTGSAATLGVQVNELFASFATLTGVTGNTSEVSTQLAAVFTALVKPSSEATEMARQMGVQFDAAAIKAAGGMRNFLTQLDSDIKSYASAHGMLDQEIYGKLFGSAESLRALIALNGELSDKFGENIDAMANSSGTLDACFDNMAGSGRAHAQMLENQVASMTDWIGSVASAAQPTLAYIAILGQAIAGVKLLGSALGTGIELLTGLTLAENRNTVATALATVHTKVQAMARNMLTVATGGATVGTNALTAATVALYAALTMGLSAVITGLISLFSSLGDEAEDTADSLEEVDDATSAFDNTMSNAAAEMEYEKGRLQELIKTNGDTSAAVEELNQKYGKSFGYHKEAKEWYDVLINKSEDYCKQLAYEAEAKALAAQIGAKKAEYEAKMSEYLFLKQTSLDKNGNVHHNYEREGYGKDYFEKLGDETVKLNSEISTLENRFTNCVNSMITCQKKLAEETKDTTAAVVDWQTASYTDLGKLIDEQKTKVQGLAGVPGKDSEAKEAAATLKEMEDRYNKLGKKYNLSTRSQSSKNQFDGKKLIENAETFNEIGNNIKYYETQLNNTKQSDVDKIKSLTATINKLKEQQEAVRQLYAEMGRPVDLQSLKDYDAEIEYQRGLRATASAEDLGQIDAEISALTAEREAFELKGHVAPVVDEMKSVRAVESELSFYEKARGVAAAEELAGIDKVIAALKRKKGALEAAGHAVRKTKEIETYEELEDELTFWEGRLKSCTEAEVAGVQERVSALQVLKKKWDDVLAEAGKPADVGELVDVGDFDAAIAWYEARMKRQSAEEIEETERTVLALERKREALQRLVEVPKLEQEAADLGELKGRKLRLELEAVGLDGIKGKIRSLQKLLEDVKNPLGEGQRKEVESLLKTWKKYETQLKLSELSVKAVWDPVKGVGDAVESVTDALKGNDNAWKKTTAVVDGAISMYESFSKIVGIVETVVKALGITKKAEQVATEGATAAEEAGAAVKVATAAEEVVAAGEVATAEVTEAAAKTFAANAAVPFVGVAIGGSLVATMLGLMQGLPKFANGGIAYGPTLGIFGEYAGAANNPEVVAPLSKLKSLIEPQGSVGGEVRFRIDGRTLVGVLAKEERFRSRTR